MKPLVRKILMISVSLLVALIGLIYWKISLEKQKIDLEKAFNSLPKQEFCGILRLEYAQYEGKHFRWYWKIANETQSMTIHSPTKQHYRDQDRFIYKPPQDRAYKEGEKICIQYAIDKNLQELPYLFEVYQK